MSIEKIMNTSPVIPVMVIDKVENAVPLAKALVGGGLKVLEITLRTDAALESIREIKAAVPEAIVGAGTVINTATLDQALAAGSEFIVTPGTTPSLVDAALSNGVQLLPGVNTPTEAMTLLEKGISALKFFPAEAAGGVPMLKAIGGPLPQISFCPTGGVNPHNAREYLALKNVACVGGSWMAPANLVAEGKWQEIQHLAAEAAALSTSPRA
jgi:2-dehydro-3-deoxyphosphogluconate aldolase/(4S)-4-hydroxy-2-oxoglutarate aldolase